MWSSQLDLNRTGKDIPCNLTATFQRDADGKLDLVVFCRSNDIIWGCYGANVVHFSMLLEYMALRIGCPIGKLTQVSVNWHAYLDTLESVKYVEPMLDRYVGNQIHYTPLFSGGVVGLNERIHELLMCADTGKWLFNELNDDEPFFLNAIAVLKAHEVWRHYSSTQRFEESLRILSKADQKSDWVVAATEWIQRRQYQWVIKETGG